MMNETITRAKALAALQTLAAFGRQRYREEYRAETSNGQCIGSAIGSLVNQDGETQEAQNFLADVDEAQLCAELLEDGNMHIPAGIIRVLAGDETQGTAETNETDNGRDVIIHLSASYK